MRRMIAAAASALAMVAVPALAGPVADAANAAMDRGHGTMCSLAMEPTRVDPYYPCIDFGPYRVVREYGRTSGFVAVRDAAPVRVLVSDREGERFVVPGPWVEDMAPRLASAIARLDAPPIETDPVPAAEAFVREGIAPPAPAPQTVTPPAVAASVAPTLPQAAPAPSPAPSTAHDPAAGAGDLSEVLGAISGTSR